MRRNLLGGMPVLRVFLATDVGVSGVAIIIATVSVTVIIRSLKQRVCKRTVAVLLHWLIHL